MSEAAFWAVLRRWTAATAGLALDDHQMEQLRSYLDTLVFWNRRMALVSQDDPRDIVFKHVADSLFAAAYCPDGEPVVDLGSGAGLPGLVIAVARPESPVCLVESRAKKVTFLREAVRLGNLANVEVVEGRIEDAASGPRAGHFGLAISRALGDIASFLRLAHPFLTPSGRVLAMKGPRHEEELRSAADLTPGFVLEQSIHYRIPDSTPRVLLMFHVQHS